MHRSLARRLAWLSLALVACHAHGSADRPGARRERAARVAKAAPAVLDLAVAPGRTCAVRAGGELRCWGSNESGRLGDGTDRTRRYPQPVRGITDAVQVALGPAHACVRRESGRISCWGTGGSGELGDGARQDRATPVAVATLHDAVDVGVGSRHSCAVRKDGSAWCWGDNEHGQLGDGTRRTSDVPVAVKGLPRARRVRPGDGFTCALLRDDSVWCWGLDDDGRTGAAEPAPPCGDHDWSPPCLPAPKAPVPLSPVVDLAVGDRHACAASHDGQVRCWGSTLGCEHGVSLVGPVRAPQAIESLPPVASLAGPQCARARTGELLCWGRDPGASTMRHDHDVPGYACAMARVRPELTRGATLVAAHDRGGCALRDDALWCWGDGSQGQLGDGSEVSRPEGVEVTALHRPPPSRGPTPMQTMTRALVRAGVPGQGHALVWLDADVYPDATATRAVGSIVDHAEELRGDRHDGLLPVRIVAAHGERLEVEPLGEGEAVGHCGGSSFGGFDRYALRMFVRVEDLAPVVAREYAMGYPDGSGVTLGAGVPLRPLEAGVVVRVGRLVLPLELAGGDAALSYDAPGLHTRSMARWWELPALDPRAVLTLDDRRVHVEALPERLARVRWSRPEEAGVARLHTEDGCVGLDMIADDPAPTLGSGGPGGSGEVGGGMVGLGRTTTVTYTRVREGAPAYWPGGARAGRLRASYRTREEPRLDGERRCLALAGALLVCHDAADLSSETVQELSSW